MGLLDAFNYAYDPNFAGDKRSEQSAEAMRGLFDEEQTYMAEPQLTPSQQMTSPNMSPNMVEQQRPTIQNEDGSLNYGTLIEKLLTNDNQNLQDQGATMLSAQQGIDQSATGNGQTANIKNWIFAKGQGDPRGFSEYTMDMKRAGVDTGGKSGYLSNEEKTEGGLDPSSPFVWNASGLPTPVKSSAYNNEQLKAAGWADGMANSEKFISVLESGKDYDPASWTKKIGDLLPVGGSLVQSSREQVGSQAENVWIRAKLRADSGATIKDDEMERERSTYFPQPGDGKAVQAAKAQARMIARKAMIRASGGAYTSKAEEDRAFDAMDRDLSMVVLSIIESAREEDATGDLTRQLEKLLREGKKARIVGDKIQVWEKK